MFTNNVVDLSEKRGEPRQITLSVTTSHDGKIVTECNYCGFTPLEAISFLESAKFDILKKISE